jgi:hypothetical protein
MRDDNYIKCIFHNLKKNKNKIKCDIGKKWRFSDIKKECTVTGK